MKKAVKWFFRAVDISVIAVLVFYTHQIMKENKLLVEQNISLSKIGTQLATELNCVKGAPLQIKEAQLFVTDSVLIEIIDLH